MAKLLLTKICCSTLIHYTLLLLLFWLLIWQQCTVISTGATLILVEFCTKVLQVLFFPEQICLQRTMDRKELGIIAFCPHILTGSSSPPPLFFYRRWPFTQTYQPTYTCHVQVSTGFQQQSQSPLPCYGWAGEQAWENLLSANTGQHGAEHKFTAGL